MFKTFLAALVTAVVAAPSIGSATIVYDNLTGPDEAVHSGWFDSEMGDQVTLAGTERVLTEIAIEYRGDFLDHGLDGDEFVSVQFYRNDGPAGAPGSMFYQSAPIPILSPTSTNDPQIFGGTITLSLPNILAPDTFTWSIMRFGQMSTTIGTDCVGLIAGGIPSTGASDDFVWYRHLGDAWTQTDLGTSELEVMSNYHASISAISLAISVDIDIKPGSYPNSINPNARGVIPVAILTTDDFDASTVDPQTVALEGALAREKGKSGKYGSLEDIDGDGDLDLVVQIVNEIVWGENAMEATLKGFTWDGIPIEGTDSVKIVPPDQE
jgi:hypothetical protein